ncbi:MAG: 16S rRNA (guanine(966)-N(2))-methyltransferase RsmD [Pseudobutyrivibrio sp.]|mgnify:FL=1|nr:16S rRNA (guanine(966)-N(2))-methyltransferase RsmD [Pseudobutyrivibrio sp.]
MRVIAGEKRRIQLDTPEGMNTRPTQDRIKETLFNMIGPDIAGRRFVDLFAGSGQMGIEALSRGAEFAYFFEADNKALTCIKNNLDKTDLNHVSQIYSGDIFSAIKNISNVDSIDYVFMDPPYDNLYEKKILQRLIDFESIDKYTTIIVEASLDTDFSYLSDLGYELIKEKTYKTNKHVFIQKV